MIEITPTLLLLAGYILSSLAFYEMAQNRGVPHGWMSWVPVLNVWILGALSDQYQYVVRGQVKSRRKLLLIFKIMTAVFGFLVGAVACVAFGRAMLDVMGNPGGNLEEEQIAGALLCMGGLSLILLPFWILQTVFGLMALYDVYRSCDPEEAVLFLVFSILLPLTRPFFLFFIRGREKGMPPRKMAVPRENGAQAPLCPPEPSREVSGVQPSDPPEFL